MITEKQLGIWLIFLFFLIKKIIYLYVFLNGRVGMSIWGDKGNADPVTGKVQRPQVVPSTEVRRWECDARPLSCFAPA